MNNISVLSWWIKDGITYVEISEEGKWHTVTKKKFADLLGCVESVCEIYLTKEKYYEEAH